MDLIEHRWQPFCNHQTRGEFAECDSLIGFWCRAGRAVHPNAASEGLHPATSTQPTAPPSHEEDYVHPSQKKKKSGKSFLNFSSWKQKVCNVQKRTDVCKTSIHFYCFIAYWVLFITVVYIKHYIRSSQQPRLWANKYFCASAAPNPNQRHDNKPSLRCLEPPDTLARLRAHRDENFWKRAEHHAQTFAPERIAAFLTSYLNLFATWQKAEAPLKRRARPLSSVLLSILYGYPWRPGASTASGFTSSEEGWGTRIGWWGGEGGITTWKRLVRLANNFWLWDKPERGRKKIK